MPGETEEAEEAGVLGPQCPMSPRPLSMTPPAVSQRQVPGHSLASPGGGDGLQSPGAGLAGRDRVLPSPHLSLQQVHTARDTVQDHALGVLILFALQRVEEPPELT